MRKVLFFISPIITAIGVYLILITLVFKTDAKGGLQVTSTPQATVYLNDKNIGQTPLCRCEANQMLTGGSYTIKLVPTDGSAPYEERIPINPSVITVVDWSFGSVDKQKGSTITLTKTDDQHAALSIVTIPLDVTVTLDGNDQGLAPLNLPDVTESDHELLLTKEGYGATTLRIHTVKGYKLTATVTLPVDLTAPVSSETGTLLVSPTATPTVASPSAITITVLSTPTGFLRVRDAASLSGKEIAQVHPGETYPYIDEQNGWIEITLSDGTKGWVSAQYVKKSTP